MSARIRKPANSNRSSSAAPASRKASRKWGIQVASRDELNEAKRLALIRTAGQAFKKKGFHQTSLDDIAATLNVTKPNLYYHVSGKQDLLYQCHNYALDLGEQALQYGSEGGSGREKLERTLRKYIELVNDQFYSYSLLSDLNDLTADQRNAILTRRRRFDAAFREIVRSGMADGSIRKVDEKMAVFWFMGAINKIPQWFSDAGSYSGAEIAQIYVDLISRGLSGSSD